MAKYFWLFLLVIPCTVSGRPFINCRVYAGNSPNDAKPILYELQHFDSSERLISSRIFCRGNVDTNCWESMKFLSYNTQGQMIDSSVFCANGDSTISRFYYGAFPVPDSIIMQIVTHKIVVGGQKIRDVGYESKYFYFNKVGQITKMLTQRTYSSSSSYCSKHVFKYTFRSGTNEVTSAVDTLYSTSVDIHPDFKSDTAKWYAPEVSITDYTHEGYTLQHFRMDDTTEVDRSKNTYFYDKSGRLSGEEFQTKSLGATVTYGYSKQRYFLTRSVTYFENFTQFYTYKYD